MNISTSTLCPIFSTNNYQSPKNYIIKSKIKTSPKDPNPTGSNSYFCQVIVSERVLQPSNLLHAGLAHILFSRNVESDQIERNQGAANGNSTQISKFDLN